LLLNEDRVDLFSCVVAAVVVVVVAASDGASSLRKL
jgi:hypothetical protein